MDRHDEYLQAKEQMDAEYNTVLGNELEDVKPSASSSSEFDAEITFEESGHWVWHIEELD